MGRPVSTSKQRLELFMKKINKTDGCWYWIGDKSETGYGRFYDGNKVVKAHRYSFEYFNSTNAKDGDVLHSCNNKLCVNPNHLRLGDAKENFLDSLRSNTATVGHKNGRSKFSLDEVNLIREKHIPFKMGCSKLARIYNVSRSTIKNLVFGKSYREKLSYGA